MHNNFINYYLRENERTILILFFIIGIVLRGIFTFYTYFTEGTNNWDDDWYYLSMGEQIADGNWNPSDKAYAPYMIVAPGIPMTI